jgi:hypothetical protein
MNMTGTPPRRAGGIDVTPDPNRVLIIDTMTDTETFGLVVGFAGRYLRAVVLWLDGPGEIEIPRSAVWREASGAEIRDASLRWPGEIAALLTEARRAYDAQAAEIITLHPGE